MKQKAQIVNDKIEETQKRVHEIVEQEIRQSRIAIAIMTVVGFLIGVTVGQILCFL